ERVLARPVDAGEAEDRDRLAGALSERFPRVFSVEPLAAALRDRHRRRGLVDPAAGVIAIDADGREIDDRPQVRRASDRAGEWPEHRVTLLAWRHRDEQRVGVHQRGGGFRRRLAAVEHECFDGVPAKTRRRDSGGFFARAHGAGDAVEPGAEFGEVVLGAIAKAEAEQRRHYAKASAARWTSSRAAAHSYCTDASLSRSRCRAASLASLP